MQDHELSVRMVEWAAENDVPQPSIALAMKLLALSGDINSLKGPAFDGFIEQEMERREKAERFKHFRQDDWDFYERTLRAIENPRNRSVLLVVPTLPFGEYIQELLDTNDLPLKTRRKFEWRYEWYAERECIVRLVSERSAGWRGHSVDEAVLHDAVGWRTYEQIMPCVRRRRALS
jgi:hypothetical protein